MVGVSCGGPSRGRTTRRSPLKPRSEKTSEPWSFLHANLCTCYIARHDFCGNSGAERRTTRRMTLHRSGITSYCCFLRRRLARIWHRSGQGWQGKWLTATLLCPIRQSICPSWRTSRSRLACRRAPRVRAKRCSPWVGNSRPAPSRQA